MAAFTITSDMHNTLSPVKDLYNYLIDFKNFKSILPEDKVENFESTDDSCSFTIKGITALTVKRVEQAPFSTIVFESEGLAKFNFRLQVNFTQSPEGTGSCNVQLKADLNPFIKVMAEKPLSQLVNTMTVKLSQLVI
ncbi:MAG: SRPBCC family protein [Bacteroidia bacterium]